MNALLCKELFCDLGPLNHSRFLPLSLRDTRCDRDDCLPLGALQHRLSSGGDER